MIHPWPWIKTSGSGKLEVTKYPDNEREGFRYSVRLYGQDGGCFSLALVGPNCIPVFHLSFPSIPSPVASLINRTDRLAGMRDYLSFSSSSIQPVEWMEFSHQELLSIKVGLILFVSSNRFSVESAPAGLHLEYHNFLEDPNSLVMFCLFRTDSRREHHVDLTLRNPAKDNEVGHERY